MSYPILAALFLATTQTFDLPKGLLESLCFVESSHRPSAVNLENGKGSSLGVCQVRLNTAKFLGFQGTEKQLMDPATNIYFAGRYLSYQSKRYQGDTKKAVAAYNAGSYRLNDKGEIMNRQYVNKVYKQWRKK